MGFLDQLWGDARNLAGQQEGGALPHALLSALGGGEGKADEAAGLTTLIGQFRQAGLGSVVESWISNEQKNQPVSTDQVHQALGEDQIMAIAQKAGMPKGAVLEALAAILPKVVDSMTPNGQVPHAPDRAPLQNAGRSPDQAAGEAEAPQDTGSGTADQAVNRVDPTESTQAGNTRGS